MLKTNENISDDASGQFVEGVLESMAEYYSNELSQKIRRGLDINAEKCLSTGSNPALDLRLIPTDGSISTQSMLPSFKKYLNGMLVVKRLRKS